MPDDVDGDVYDRVLAGVAVVALVLTGVTGGVYAVRAPPSADLPRDTGLVPVEAQCDAVIEETVTRAGSDLAPLVLTRDPNGTPSRVRMVPERRAHRHDVLGGNASRLVEEYEFVDRLGGHDCADGENASALVLVVHVDTLDPAKTARLPDEFGGMPVVVQFSPGLEIPV